MINILFILKIKIFNIKKVNYNILRNLNFYKKYIIDYDYLFLNKIIKDFYKNNTEDFSLLIGSRIKYLNSRQYYLNYSPDEKPEEEGIIRNIFLIKNPFLKNYNNILIEIENLRCNKLEYIKINQFQYPKDYYIKRTINKVIQRKNYKFCCSSYLLKNCKQCNYNKQNGNLHL